MTSRNQIVLDARVLDNVGVGNDTPVTVNLNGVTLRLALRTLLNDLELTYAG